MRTGKLNPSDITSDITAQSSISSGTTLIQLTADNVNVINREQHLLDTRLVSAVLTDRPPPIIRQGPSNQTLGVDSVALLKCQASGDPIPSISWLKDGLSLLGKDPRMSLQELGSLQIRNIKVKGRFLASPADHCSLKHPLSVPSVCFDRTLDRVKRICPSDEIEGINE